MYPPLGVVFVAVLVDVVSSSGTEIVTLFDVLDAGLELVFLKSPSGLRPARLPTEDCLFDEELEEFEVVAAEVPFVVEAVLSVTGTEAVTVGVAVEGGLVLVTPIPPSLMESWAYTFSPFGTDIMILI